MAEAFAELASGSTTGTSSATWSVVEDGEERQLHPIRW